MKDTIEVKTTKENVIKGAINLCGGFAFRNALKKSFEAMHESYNYGGLVNSIGEKALGLGVFVIGTEITGAGTDILFKAYKELKSTAIEVKDAIKSVQNDTETVEEDSVGDEEDGTE